jgi:ppGpp synthetase/RelA/SpoT-type nucleotidyltranferase
LQFISSYCQVFLTLTINRLFIKQIELKRLGFQKERIKSAMRIADCINEVGKSLTMKEVRKAIQDTKKESSLHSKMKKTGLALLAMPDPLTDIPGLALIVASHFMKRRESASIMTLSSEIRKTLKDLEHLRL